MVSGNVASPLSFFLQHRCDPLQAKALSVQKFFVSVSHCTACDFHMATKMKGIYKSLKYITQIFVVKEREIEIGYPTDVKHVAHIGWDGPSGSGPSWMNEFKSAPDFSTSLGNLGDRREPSPLSTTIMPHRDNAESSKRTSNKSKDTPSSDLPGVPKKQKRRKTKLVSPKSSSSSVTKHLRAAKSATACTDREATPPVVQV